MSSRDAGPPGSTRRLTPPFAQIATQSASRGQLGARGVESPRQSWSARRGAPKTLRSPMPPPLAHRPTEGAPHPIGPGLRWRRRASFPERLDPRRSSLGGGVRLETPPARSVVLRPFPPRYAGRFQVRGPVLRSVDKAISDLFGATARAEVVAQIPATLPPSFATTRSTRSSPTSSRRSTPTWSSPPRMLLRDVKPLARVRPPRGRRRALQRRPHAATPGGRGRRRRPARRLHLGPALQLRGLAGRPAPRPAA